MKEEYEDRASALLKGLKSNPKDDPASNGGSSSSAMPGMSGFPGVAPIKKKKKLWLILVPLFLLLGVGGFVGLVFAGLVRNPQLEAMLKIKHKGTVAKPTVEVAKDTPVNDPPAANDLPGVGKGKGKTKDPPPPVIDPQKGAQKLASVWSEMEPLQVSKLAVGYKDPEFASVIAEMDSDKAAAVLGALNPKRSAKISKLIQTHASIIKPEE